MKMTYLSDAYSVCVDRTNLEPDVFVRHSTVTWLSGAKRKGRCGICVMSLDTFVVKAGLKSQEVAGRRPCASLLTVERCEQRGQHCVVSETHPQTEIDIGSSTNEQPFQWSFPSF